MKKKLGASHWKKFLSSESIPSLTPLYSHFVNWKIYLLMSNFKKRHYEQKIEIVLIFSFFKFLFLIHIQIVSNNHNKLIKTLSCTANKSISRYMMYYNEGWHCIAILKILWIMKQHSKVVRFYVFTRLNGILTFNVW